MIHFHQFQRGTADRVRYQRVNERTGKEVDFEEIVKGRETSGGNYVLIEPEELDGIAPGRSRTVDITGFVDLDDIDPIYVQKTYYLAPQGDEYGRTYALLLQALQRSHSAGIAMFVMRGKQYLTAIRPQKSVLVLQTMYFKGEIRDPKSELGSLPARARFSGKEVDMAVRLIDSLHIDWTPGKYRDTYTARVEKLIEAKRRGEEVVAEGVPPESTNVVDLMDALRRSLDGAGRSASKSGRGGKARSTTKSGKSRTMAKSGTGRKADSDLSGLTKTELYQRATALKVPRRSQMDRVQLERAVRSAARKKAS